MVVGGEFVIKCRKSETKKQKKMKKKRKKQPVWIKRKKSRTAESRAGTHDNEVTPGVYRLRG